ITGLILSMLVESSPASGPKSAPRSILSALPKPLAWGGLIFFVLLACSALQSVALGRSLQIIVFSLAAGAGFFVSYSNKALIWSCLVAVLAGTIAGMMGIHEYLTSIHQYPDWRTQGTFVNPGLLSGYLAIT